MVTSSSIGTANHVQDGGVGTIQFGDAGQLPVIGAWTAASAGTRVGTCDAITHDWSVDANGSNNRSGIGAGARTKALGVSPSSGAR